MTESPQYFSACNAEEQIREKGMMAAWIGRRLGLYGEDRRYTGLVDRAIKWAQLRDPATNTTRPDAPVSEDIAYTDLKRYWNELVRRRGKDEASDEFFKSVVGIVPCSYPCQPKIDFSGQSLDISCIFENNFKPGASVVQVQNEVRRIAAMMGITVPRIDTKAIKSTCGARRLPITELSAEDRRRALEGGKAKQAQLTAAQQVVSQICGGIMMTEFTKGALLWHTVGAGKTCAAVATASVFVEKGWRVKWFSTAQLKYPPLYDAFFKRICHQFEDVNTSATSEAQRKVEIHKVLKVDSYATLSNAFDKPARNQKAKEWLKEASRMYGPGGVWEDEDFDNNDPLYRTLIIFDEPHKIPQISNENERFKWSTVTRAIRNSYVKSGNNSCRLLLMDATPMLEDVSQLIVMLNAFHPVDIMPTNFSALQSQGYVSKSGMFTKSGVEAMTKLGNGLISYINLSNDHSKFAYPKKFSFTPVALSEKQIDKMYNGKEACASKKNIDRKRVCVEKSAVSVDMPKSPTPAEMRKRSNESFPLLANLVKNIEALDEADMRDYGNHFKHVIFTNVADAAHADNILKVLQYNGYKKVDPLVKSSGSTSGKGVIMMSGFGLNGTIKVPQLGNLEKKDVITSMFNNHVNNRHGERARFMVVDGRFREGINLFDVRHFHMLQPLSEFEERQAVGRVLRMCGSTFLPADDNIWSVNVHLYDSVDLSKGESIYDALNVRNDTTKINSMDDGERIASSIAFDKKLFQHFNVVAEDKDYEFKKGVITSHLCSIPVVDGKCPLNHSIRNNKAGAECCEQTCKTSPDVDGKCRKGFIAGPSEVNPKLNCCYSIGSKRGKEIKAGLPAKALSPTHRQRGNKKREKEQQEYKEPELDHVEEEVEMDEGDEIEVEMDEGEIETELDESDEIDMMELDEEESVPVYPQAKKPKSRGKQKAPCPGALTQPRRDGTCGPGLALIESTVNPDKECCKNACGRFSKPERSNMCKPGFEAFDGLQGVKCCRKAKVVPKKRR